MRIHALALVLVAVPSCHAAGPVRDREAPPEVTLSSTLTVSEAAEMIASAALAPSDAGWSVSSAPSDGPVSAAEAFSTTWPSEAPECHRFSVGKRTVEVHLLPDGGSELVFGWTAMPREFLRRFD